jgi:hypothetical protein
LDAAVEHMNEMRLDPALALLEPLCADDLDAQTPADRVALATALCLKGLVLDRLKRHEEAFEAHRRCLKRYGMVLEPGVQECVTRCRDSDAMRRALERNPTMLAELPAAHHALRLSTNLDQAATIQTELTDHPEARQQSLDTLFELVLSDNARAGAQHDAALAILHDHFTDARPFGIYLRNFDIVASEKRMSDGTLLTMTTSEPAHIEARVERDLASTLPVIGLANGVNFRRDFEHAIPKLEVANGLWQTVLRIMAERAELILFDYRHPSPGVVVELELLQSLRRAPDTVVVVADEAARIDVCSRRPAFTRVQLPDEPLPSE